jgi:GxxExxY protein
MSDNELTEKIIVCAFRVHNALSPGFSEKVYENSMRVALNHERIKVKHQVAIQVYFEGEVVGEFVPDLWVEDRLLVELNLNSEVEVWDTGPNHVGQAFQPAAGVSTFWFCRQGSLSRFAVEKRDEKSVCYFYY